MKKTFFVILIVQVLILSAQTTHATFSDVSSKYPYSEAILYMQSSGIVSGYLDGTFRPNAKINRAEFTKIVVSSIKNVGSQVDDFRKCYDDYEKAECGYSGSCGQTKYVLFGHCIEQATPEYKSCYGTYGTNVENCAGMNPTDDVYDVCWNKYIPERDTCLINQLGISNDEFSIDHYYTNLARSYLELFGDVPVSEWYAKFIYFARPRSIVGGYPDGNFHPSNNINAVEAFKILTNAFYMNTEVADSDQMWFEKYLRPMSAGKFIPTSIDSLDKFITRGEVVEMIWRIRENIQDRSFMSSETLLK